MQNKALLLVFSAITVTPSPYNLPLITAIQSPSAILSDQHIQYPKRQKCQFTEKRRQFTEKVSSTVPIYR